MKPLFEHGQRIGVRPWLNDRQSHKVPVDTEIRCLLPAGYCKMHLLYFARVDWLAADHEFLFEYAKFLESFRELKSDSVSVDLPFQFDFDFKSHGHIRASASEVLRPDQVADPVRTPPDLLQNL